MDLKPFFPNRDCLQFYWRVLRMRWVHVLGAFVVVEALVGVFAFAIMLCSETASEKFVAFIVAHPIVSLLPAATLALMTFMVGAFEMRDETSQRPRLVLGEPTSMEKSTAEQGFALKFYVLNQGERTACGTSAVAGYCGSVDNPSLYREWGQFDYSAERIPPGTKVSLEFDFPGAIHRGPSVGKPYAKVFLFLRFKYCGDDGGQWHSDELWLEYDTRRPTFMRQVTDETERTYYRPFVEAVHPTSDA